MTDEQGATVRAEGGIPWGRLGIEMAVIVFSVLLALVLDDWRQGRTQTELVASVSLSLQAELERNQRILEARMPYHAALLDSIASVREGGGTRASPSEAPPSLADLGFDRDLGVSPGLSRAAWETALASGAIPDMDVSLVFMLSSGHTTQSEIAQAEGHLMAAYERYQLAVSEGEQPGFATLRMAHTLEGLLERQETLCDWYQGIGRQIAPQPEDPGECGSGHLTIR